MRPATAPSPGVVRQQGGPRCRSPSDRSPRGKKGSKNAPHFDLRTELYRITGIDWAQINGIDVLTAQTVITEAGADLKAFPSEKQFASWLGLCPDQRDQRRKGAEAAYPQGGQPGRHGLPQRRLHAAAQPELSGSAIPPPADPPRRTEGDHRHGAQTGLSVLPTHQARTAVRRQGHRILRSEVSRAADPSPDQTRPKAWASSRYPRSSRESAVEGFWQVSTRHAGVRAPHSCRRLVAP